MIKMEGIFDAPVFNVLTAVNEVNKYSKWVPFCTESREIKRIDRNFISCYLRLWIPPPLSDRECYASCYGLIRKNNSVVIIVRTYDENEAFQKRHGVEVPSKTKHVRFSLTFAFEITPLNHNKMKIRIFTTANLKIKIVPLFVINFMMRKMAMGSFEKLVAEARKLKPSTIEALMKEPSKKDFYDWLTT
jgi:hypothetical protein